VHTQSGALRQIDIDARRDRYAQIGIVPRRLARTLGIVAEQAFGSALVTAKRSSGELLKVQLRVFDPGRGGLGGSVAQLGL
jgi:hypothetical protein